jgi:thiol-disulfide isomerase/thioredoxin
MGRKAGYVPEDSSRSHGGHSTRLWSELRCSRRHGDSIHHGDQVLLSENVSSDCANYLSKRSVCSIPLTLWIIIYVFRLVTDLSLDNTKETRLRMNFNVTLMDLKCEYAVVDVVSVLGTEQNVTAHVNKWDVSSGGVRQRYQGRNKQQADILHFDETVRATLEDLHEDGVDAVDLDSELLQMAIKRSEYVFVDFFASWCSHCQHLAPTWETLAEVMTIVAEGIVEEREHAYSDEEYKHAVTVELPVMIGKVDCVANDALCRQQGIMAYPTLRLFVDGERWKAGDYRGDRTVVAMADYLKEIEDYHKAENEKNGIVVTKTTELAHKGTLLQSRLRDLVCWH